MDDRQWDAIVVGSGLGGLTTAAYLAANGRRTLVLEQYDTAGGSSQVFRRKRQWEFDVGLHYLGDCRPGGLIPTVLAGVGLGDRIDFLPMDRDGFDTLMFPGLTFRVPAGWDRYRERLIRTFPDEERGIDRCVTTLEKVAAEIMRAGTPTGVWGMVKTGLRSRNVIRHGMSTLGHLFDSCGLSEQARGVLAGESGDYAVAPSRASLLLHAVLMDHYLRSGGYYPRGGGQVLAAHLVDVIQVNGGRVRTRATVRRIAVADGRVRGVELADGERIEAPVVVSNADLKRTMVDMVGSEHLSGRTLARIRKGRMALPIFSVYLGVDVDLRETRPNTNYWVFPEFDQERHYADCAAGRIPDDLPLYITSASLKDPFTRAIAPEGSSSMEIMTAAPAAHAVWGLGDGLSGMEHYSRRPEYREAKRRLEERLVARACEIIPEIEGRISWQESATPITHERYTLATGGTSYGLEATPDQMGFGRPKPRTEVGGLFLAGASTMYGHGIAGVMMGGIGCAGTVLERDLLSEVRSGRVFGDPAKLTAGGEGWDPLMACKRLAVKPKARTKRRAVPV